MGAKGEGHESTISNVSTHGPYGREGGRDDGAKKKKVSVGPKKPQQAIDKIMKRMTQLDQDD